MRRPDELHQRRVWRAPGCRWIGPAFIAFLWEEKSTANVNLTWVKGNHTFKYGGELID